MPNSISQTPASRVERSAPRRVRPLGLRLPSKRTSPFFGGYPSSNRTCRFPAYGSPCGTGFIGFAPLRLSAPFHIDSNGCSSIWTSGFRRAATWRIVPYCSLSTLFFSPFDLHRPFYTQRPFAPLLGHRFATRLRLGGYPRALPRFPATTASSDSSFRFRYCEVSQVPD